MLVKIASQKKLQVSKKNLFSKHISFDQTSYKLAYWCYQTMPKSCDMWA